MSTTLYEGTLYLNRYARGARNGWGTGIQVTLPLGGPDGYVQITDPAEARSIGRILIEWADDEEPYRTVKEQS